MTTTVKVHVNGHYRAFVKQDDKPPVIVEGNYKGSSNPSGEGMFHLVHSFTPSTFQITEQEVAPIDTDKHHSGRETRK
jgi:hypothetical protein